MPELPEVETVRRGLAPVLEGRIITEVEARRPDLRYPLPEGFAERLRGRRVETLTRRAKYLLAMLDDDEVLVMHLGMSGSFRIESAPATGDFHRPRSRDPKHDHVVFRIDDGPSVIYNDPRRFGFMHLITASALHDHRHLRNLGIEPVGDALTPEALALRLAGRRAPLKAALLDQTVIAGLGNIYVCEALWRARLSPRREAGSLVLRDGRPSIRLRRLTGHIRDVIIEAIDAGGSSLRDHARTDGAMGYFQQRLQVYDRMGAPCPRAGCRGTVSRVVQSGRATFLCTACQR